MDVLAEDRTLRYRCMVPLREKLEMALRFDREWAPGAEILERVYGKAGLVIERSSK